ncbi:MAG TPA: hypothetical protein VFU24_11620 [Burkholderiales bacterium]|nr:hypothetical protein [Burkholderiales bacterium]
MEHRALASLILRIAGLLLVVTTVANAAKSFAPLFYAGNPDKVGIGLLLLAGFVTVVIPILLGIVLIYFPRAMTTRVLRVEGLESGDASNTAALQRVAFAVTGMWLAAYAVIDSVYTYARVRLYYRFLEEMPSYARPPSISADDFAALVSSALQLVIGLWLLIGNRGIVNALSRLRG